MNTKRLTLKDIIKNSLFADDEIKKLCLKTGDNPNGIVMKRRIGSDSVNGEAFRACYPLNCEYKISVKKTPLSRQDIEFMGNRESTEVLEKSEVWKEMFILEMVNELVKNNVCPNLPLIYGVYQCEDCQFTNKNLIQRGQKECLLIVNELAHGDLKQLLQSQNTPSVRKMAVYYFQIFVGLYSIKKYYDIYHDDMHWGNVLFHNLDSKKKITYTLNDKSVTLTTQRLMVVWDFGLSQIPDKIRTQKQGMTHLDDFIRITWMLLVENNKYITLFVEIMNILKTSVYLEDIIYKFMDYLNPSVDPNEEVDEEYIINQDLDNFKGYTLPMDREIKIDHKNLIQLGENINNKIDSAMNNPFITVFIDSESELVKKLTNVEGPNTVNVDIVKSDTKLENDMVVDSRESDMVIDTVSSDMFIDTSLLSEHDNMIISGCDRVIIVKTN